MANTCLCAPKHQRIEHLVLERKHRFAPIADVPKTTDRVDDEADSVNPSECNEYPTRQGDRAGRPSSQGGADVRPPK
jgi:hypothetical protein